jgi:magnesium-protoporphyrin O-methyltransferase
MAGCCPSRDYRRIFNQRFARRLANRYRRRGLDPTARKMVEFLQAVGIEGASVLEIGGGVGEIEIELLQAGAARAQNLELSAAYEQQALTLAAQAGVHGRIDWRLHDLAADPGAVAPADLVILHRVVCCYADYERLLGAAANHAQRALVFSYPPCNPLSRTFYSVFNLVMRLTRSSFRGFAHPPGAMLGVLEDHGLRRTFQRRSRIWQVAGLERVSRDAAPLNRTPHRTASGLALPHAQARPGNQRRAGQFVRFSLGYSSALFASRQLTASAVPPPCSK